MVEGRQIFPRFRGMTRLTSHWLAVFAGLFHLVGELSIVRILMAARASKVRPMILRRRLGLEAIGLLVTFRTGNGYVASRKEKMGFLVTSERER